MYSRLGEEGRVVATIDFGSIVEYCVDQKVGYESKHDGAQPITSTASLPLRNSSTIEDDDK